MPMGITLVFLLAAVIAAMLLWILVVRRHPYARRLPETNDIAGFYVTLLGGLYGVFLGFMVLVVWTRFDQAETLVEQEAAAAVNAFSLAGNLREPYRGRMRTDLERYVTIVIQREWPAMSEGRYHAEGAFKMIVRLSKEGGEFKPQDMREQVLLDQMLTQINAMHAQRRLRLLANQKGLPIVFWMVLIVGAILTVGATAFFGVERFSFHALKTALLTTLVCLTLYAIQEVDGPFRGEIHVSSEPFRRAQMVFEEMKAQEAGRPLLIEE